MAIRRTLAASCLLLAFGAVAASAGPKPPNLSLHPSAFGPGAAAGWAAKQGLPDSHGNAQQALYLQKFAPTATNSGAEADFNGIEGTPVSSLTGLSWLHRIDGHCGAGAPRWDILIH